MKAGSICRGAPINERLLPNDDDSPLLANHLNLALGAQLVSQYLVVGRQQIVQFEGLQVAHCARGGGEVGLVLGDHQAADATVWWGV